MRIFDALRTEAQSVAVYPIGCISPLGATTGQAVTEPTCSNSRRVFTISRYAVKVAMGGAISAHLQKMRREVGRISTGAMGAPFPQRRYNCGVKARKSFHTMATSRMASLSGNIRVRDARETYVSAYFLARAPPLVEILHQSGRM